MRKESQSEIYTYPIRGKEYINLEKKKKKKKISLEEQHKVYMKKTKSTVNLNILYYFTYSVHIVVKQLRHTSNDIKSNWFQDRHHLHVTT